MANNALLFNAALSGYAAGALAGQQIVDPVQADYTAQTTQASAWATALDTAIATDTAGAPQPAGSTGISVAGGAGIQPAGSSAVLESQNMKTSLIWSLSYSIAFQRASTGVAGAAFATQVAAVKAYYFSLVLAGVYT